MSRCYVPDCGGRAVDSQLLCLPHLDEANAEAKKWSRKNGVCTCGLEGNGDLPKGRMACYGCAFTLAAMDDSVRSGKCRWVNYDGALPNE